MSHFRNPPAMPGQTEFVVLVSVVMMIVAFSIDSMLPALPAIGQGLGMGDESRRPLVISAFLLGFGAGQLVIGTLSDRYGRRGLMLASLFGFVLTSLAATLAPSFGLLLVARAAQGVMCAGARVIIVSIVRDRFAGRAMAQVMSLASMVFMAAPVLAPTMGQLVLFAGSWRWIFGVLAIIGLVVWIWVLRRLPETLAVENRLAINPINIRASAWSVVSDRMSLGYGLAMAAISCGLFGFLMSVQPIFEHVFKRPELLPSGFAVIAAGMAAASLLNATIVKRFGMRLIGHSALLFFIAIAALHLLVAVSGYETMYSFIGLQMLMMMGFALVAGNFSAMAMENMGRVAGMASSLQGSLANLAAALVGTLIGQAFDRSTVPLYLGFLGCGLFALVTVLITERGRLFVAHHAPVDGE